MPLSFSPEMLGRPVGVRGARPAASAWLLGLAASLLAAAAQAQAERVQLNGRLAPPLLLPGEPGLAWRQAWGAPPPPGVARWQYQVGLEQHTEARGPLGPQAPVHEAVWAGVALQLTPRWSGGVEAPVWQRETVGAARMAFRPAPGGSLSGLRGAFTYQLGPQSRLVLKPQARRVVVTLSATW